MPALAALAMMALSVSPAVAQEARERESIPTIPIIVKASDILNLQPAKEDGSQRLIQNLRPAQVKDAPEYYKNMAKTFILKLEFRKSSGEVSGLYKDDRGGGWQSFDYAQAKSPHLINA